MDKTLYLTENRGLAVLRDGPSIWVKEDGKAGRRIPARLVSRVVIIGNLKMETGAITLFTENGIPVTYMNMHGKEVAVTIPYNHNLPRHYEEQKVFLETEENIQRFKRWALAKRRQVQIDTIKRLSRSIAAAFICRGFRERDYQEFINGYISVRQEQWKVISDIIGNLFREMIIGNLMKADLDPHMGVLHRRHNFGLALDICYIMGPEIDLQSIQFFRCSKECNFMIKGNQGWSVSKDGMKDIVHRFENRRKALKEMIEMILDELFGLMRELRV